MDYQNYNGEMLFYPIEIFGSHNYFIKEASVKRNDVVEQSIKFTKVVSNEAIELAKLNKLKFIFNISHEPFSDINFLSKFSTEIKKINLKESDFIFFGGSSNYHSLGYKSEWFNLTDVLNKRSKHFVCPNRNSNKSHRFTLGCFFEITNLWDKIYCSFLQKPKSIQIIKHLSIDFENKIKEFTNNFLEKLPIEMDTENLNESEKESFESMRSFKIVSIVG